MIIGNIMKRQAPATSSTCSRPMKGKQVTLVDAYVCCVRVSYAIHYTMATRVLRFTEKNGFIDLPTRLGARKGKRIGPWIQLRWLLS